MPESSPPFHIGDPRDSGSHCPSASDLAALLTEGYLGSVWLTGQTASRDLRRGRYTPESLTHPGKMLPTIPRYAIRTYTNPGDLVLDPMAGIGTTVIEAMHLGRHGIGVEYEAEWVAKAADNIHHTVQAGAPGRGEIYHGDSTALPSLLPASLHGQVSLVITSPPYGSSTHGHVRTPDRDAARSARSITSTAVSATSPTAATVNWPTASPKSSPAAGQCCGPVGTPSSPHGPTAATANSSTSLAWSSPLVSTPAWNWSRSALPSSAASATV
ncbi:hypothetical protein GCM10029963_72640 [Micromonospora andamanensis]